MNQNVLPESRLSTSRVVVRRGGMNWVNVYCANCGKEHGLVPEENCTFACFLCDPCALKWGEQYGYAVMPDEMFWEKVMHEMTEKYGRGLTAIELQQHVESGGCNSLSLLLREAPSTF